MKSKNRMRGKTILAYIVLIFLSFLCLFFFYILIVNATRSHADLQKGFSAIPGTYFLENLKNVANDGSFPMFKGILNSLIVSACSAALCTYFSALTAYGLYAYDFKAKKSCIYIYHGNTCHADTSNGNGFSSADHKYGYV